MNDENTPLLNDPSAVTVIDIPKTKGFQNTARRSSFVTGSVGRKGFVVDAFLGDSHASDASVGEDRALLITEREAAQLAREERQLLNDNRIAYTSLMVPSDDSQQSQAPSRKISVPEILSTAKAWDTAVSEGQLTTTVHREIRTLIKTSSPLIVTFLLQYSLTVASIFCVGHIGKTELGAVSLASMTASITGYAMIQGLATCLDTLCAQAYGAGNLLLVGIYFQRCVLMVLVAFFPVGIFWIFSDRIMIHILPDKDVAILAMHYLRIVAFGTPGYILFECGKRFTQAQGIFHASTMVLFICAPLNAILNYVLVWNKTIGLGYKGAAVAVATTDWLMAIFLLLYVIFIDGKQCWPGFSKRALTGWNKMLKLAIPGVIMVEAEFMAFEILTFAASYFGTTALAAQSVLSTITSLSYQIPFAVSIASSTRVANFLGSTLGGPAKIAAYVAISCSFGIALFNGVVLYVLRYRIGALFSSDADVLDLVAAIFPLCATMQLVDATAGVAAGVLRGQGRQKIGGYLNLFFYYAVGIPLSFALAFSAGWGLFGLWTGITVGLTFISVGQILSVIYSDWDGIVELARSRVREERIAVHPE